MAQKNSLTIRLNESVVFLRSADVTGQRRSNDAQSSVLRGLLVLNVVKPTRISSIEIQLQGRTSTSWPEGIGARRIEITEDYKIFSVTTVFFSADSTPSARRTTSLGPGLTSYHEEETKDFSDDDFPRNNLITPHNADTSIRQDDAPRPHQGPRRVSADHSAFQRHPHSQHEDSYLMPTPPYTPPFSPPLNPIILSPSTSEHASLNTSSSSPRTEDNPAQNLEEFRNALRAGLETDRLNPPAGNVPPHLNDSSASSTNSYRDVSLSRRTSIEDVPGKSANPIHSTPATFSHSLGTTTPTTPDNGHDTSRGRKHSRFSLTAVSNALLDAVNVRSNSPGIGTARHSTVPQERAPNGGTDLDHTLARGRRHDKGKDRENKEKSALSKFSGILGLEGDEKKESGDGWKEFKKGVYTYPISFTVPGDYPPSLECDYGSVTWRLKAQVHRPGAFTSKLTSTKDVILISSPDEDAMEDTENIIIERQWDSQLQYLISVSGRSFYIGGVIPIHLTIMPFTKAKFHRISVILEERVDYYTQMRRIARTDPIHRILLLSLKIPTKEGGPILPLDSDDPEAFKKSPIYAMLSPEDDASEMASSLFGPGPWELHHNLRLPSSCGLLHFTNKNRRSNISVTHILKIIFRVERGDDQFIDSRTGKRKLFDIVVQTPIHILSCRCNPEWTSLPRYSQSLEDAFAEPLTCPCKVKRKVGTMVNTDDGDSSVRKLQGKMERIASRQSTDSASMAGDSPVNPTTMPSLRAQDSLFSRNNQFERLVSGQESEMGEVPPAYAGIV